MVSAMKLLMEILCHVSMSPTVMDSVDILPLGMTDTYQALPAHVMEARRNHEKQIIPLAPLEAMDLFTARICVRDYLEHFRADKH